MSRESKAGARQSPLLGSEVNEGCCLNTTVEPTVKASPECLQLDQGKQPKDSLPGDAVQTRKRLCIPRRLTPPSAKALL